MKTIDIINGIIKITNEMMDKDTCAKCSFKVCPALVRRGAQIGNLIFEYRSSETDKATLERLFNALNKIMVIAEKDKDSMNDMGMIFRTAKNALLMPN